MFDQDQFLADLKTFVGFRTCVETNPDDFARARAWITHTDVHVLMSDPKVVGLHSDDERLVAAYLEPYYQRVLERVLFQI